MFYFKRFLLLGGIGMLVLTGLMFAGNTRVSTAHASGCTTVAEDYTLNTDGKHMLAYWNNTCTVSQGNSSNAVYGIQLDINTSGTTDPQTGKRCTVGTVDGDFGPATAAGVECFQDAEGINDDTIVGQQTWSTLSFFIFDASGTLNPGWNYFNSSDFRMWGQSPYKWYVNAGGCWRQMDENSSACA